MADHPGLSAKDGQALIDQLTELSTNMRQAAGRADAFVQSIAQLFPGTVVAPQPTVTVTGKKRGRAPKEGKRVKDPNAPKRPATSYIMFQNDVRDELRQKHPELPYKELLGKVSEAWAVLGENQKKAYQDVADSNMAKYNRAVIDYKGTLNGHAAAAAAGSAAPTPEVDEEEEEEEEEEEAPPTKKSKAAAPAPVPATESDEDSDAASSASEESETPAVPPPPPVKAPKPTSAKEKKKAKK